jgi:hypothetical protein
MQINKKCLLPLLSGAVLAIALSAIADPGEIYECQQPPNGYMGFAYACPAEWISVYTYGSCDPGLCPYPWRWERHIKFFQMMYGCYEPCGTWIWGEIQNEPSRLYARAYAYVGYVNEYYVCHSEKACDDTGIDMCPIYPNICGDLCW